MIGQSGCFGKTYDPPIDDIREAGAAVADIVAGMAVEDPGTRTPDPSSALAAKMLFETARRVRLLSWTVMAVVAYLVIKELN